MSMDFNAMAQAIHNEMGFPGSPSDDLKGWSRAIIQELTSNGVVSNSSGTITGIAPPIGGPLLNGAGSNGLVASLDKTNLANNVSSFTGKTPVNAKLLGFADAITSHIMNTGKVVFDSEAITGICTNTLITPGIFTGSGSGGKITSLDGSILADLAKDNADYPSTSPELIKFCTAIVTYIMNNAEINYSSCSGTVSAGGGPLIGGSANSGTIL